MDWGAADQRDLGDTDRHPCYGVEGRNAVAQSRVAGYKQVKKSDLGGGAEHQRQGDLHRHDMLGMHARLGDSVQWDEGPIHTRVAIGVGSNTLNKVRWSQIVFASRRSKIK